MSQPMPPADSVPAYSTARTDPAWTAPAAPSWTPGWAPPGQAPAPVAAPEPQRTAHGPLVLGGVALAGLLAGAVGSAFLVTAVFVGSAEDIGREIGTAMGSQMSEDLARTMADVTESLLVDPYGVDEGAVPGAFGPVEEFPPVAPEALGPDPVLNEYAQSCFEGDLQACDDLMYGSAPLSAYEDYAITCGGRVKVYAVLACTDLE
jgi:hypothetical protein